MSLSQVNAENITGSNKLIALTTQQVYNADETSLTITNSSTLSRSGQAAVNINEQGDATLTIHSGSSLTANFSQYGTRKRPG